MTDALHRLIYCSKSTLDGGAAVEEREIQSILAAARRENRRAGVTGALLFTNGCFVQTLEGERSPLEDVFERIQCDERHRDVTILAFEPIAERAFPGWDMAYLSQDEAAPPDLAAAALNEAVARGLAGEEDVLALMRGVVAREREWANL